MITQLFTLRVAANGLLHLEVGRVSVAITGTDFELHSGKMTDSDLYFSGEL
jgi:hypothetical protein